MIYYEVCGQNLSYAIDKTEWVKLDEVELNGLRFAKLKLPDAINPKGMYFLLDEDNYIVSTGFNSVYRVEDGTVVGSIEIGKEYVIDMTVAKSGGRFEQFFSYKHSDPVEKYD